MIRHALKLVAASCAMAFLAGSGQPVAAAPAKDGQGVCEGVRRCHKVARVDVNGDGDPDPVGLARRKEGDESYVLVRVKVGPERIVTTRRKTTGFYGPPWQGAARLDGVPGKDLLIGYLSGAHTQFFHGITWREGELTTLDAPGRDVTWVIDGAYSISFGWLRRGSWPEGTIRKRVATRDESEEFKGRITAYRWKDGGWDVAWSKSVKPSEDEAYSWGGFHVPGLQRW